MNRCKNQELKISFWFFNASNYVSKLCKPLLLPRHFLYNENAILRDCPVKLINAILKLNTY